MATIGLSDLYYATITEAALGSETYGTPAKLAKAISADLSIEIAEAILYADDAASETIKSFKNGKLTLSVDDLGTDKAALLTGGSVDKNGVLINSTENVAPYVAIGFRAQKANGKYRYFWLYKVQFAPISTSLQTKGDSITFQTPSIEGTIIRRNKEDASGLHPWKAEVTEGDEGVESSVITGWFSQVYEPTYKAATTKGE